MRVLAIDVGGSGLKSAIFVDGKRETTPSRQALPEFEPQPFADWIKSTYGSDYNAIAISLPGAIDAQQQVQYCFKPRWMLETDLSALVSAATGVGRVHLINDVEAHALAAVTPTGVQVCVAIGTSVGAAVRDANNLFLRPANSSLDLGGIRLPSSLPDTRAPYAASSRALDELERIDAAGAPRAYRASVAALLETLTVLVAGDSIVLSGGLLAHRSDILDGLDREIEARLPRWFLSRFGAPKLSVNEDPEWAALRGCARLAESDKGVDVSHSMI